MLQTVKIAHMFRSTHEFHFKNYISQNWQNYKYSVKIIQINTINFTCSMCPLFYWADVPIEQV